LKEWADTAYELGSPVMSDVEYDSLFGESATVGAKVGDVPHQYQMYSLQKHYAEDGEPPLSVGLVETPKLDGCAVSLRYYSGMLVQALTRGDGKLGQPITEKMMLLVPTNLQENISIQITGEVVARKDVPNSRNMVAGSLGLKELSEFKDRISEIGLEFVAYSVQVVPNEQGLGELYVKDMSILTEFGFTTVMKEGLEDKFPLDGVVFRVNSNKEFNRLGYTSKHPRGAYAFKKKQKPVVTKLLDVVWQTGKSGKVTPVALLDSVMIGDANVSRATLNNMAYIDALNLEIGCMVEVVRSGEIIPTIVGRAD